MRFCLAGCDILWYCWNSLCEFVRYFMSFFIPNSVCAFVWFCSILFEFARFCGISVLFWVLLFVFDVIFCDIARVYAIFCYFVWFRVFSVWFSYYFVCVSVVFCDLVVRFCCDFVCVLAILFYFVGILVGFCAICAVLCRFEVMSCLFGVWHHLSWYLASDLSTPPPLPGACVPSTFQHLAFSLLRTSTTGTSQQYPVSPGLTLRMLTAALRIADACLANGCALLSTRRSSLFLSRQKPISVWARRF